MVEERYPPWERPTLIKCSTCGKEFRAGETVLVMRDESAAFCYNDVFGPNSCLVRYTLKVGRAVLCDAKRMPDKFARPEEKDNWINGLLEEIESMGRSA